MIRFALPALLLVSTGCAAPIHDRDAGGPRVHYLEFVTPDVEATCATYTAIHGVTFGEPQAELGGARTADLADGGMVAVRGPLRPDEAPTTRAYVLVDDLEAAARAAEEAGGVIAHPPWELPGYGWFAIYIQGGVEHALWQL